MWGIMRSVAFEQTAVDLMVPHSLSQVVHCSSCECKPRPRVPRRDATAESMDREAQETLRWQMHLEIHVVQAKMNASLGCVTSCQDTIYTSYSAKLGRPIFRLGGICHGFE